jgi:hypothetical protein
MIFAFPWEREGIMKNIFDEKFILLTLIKVKSFWVLELPYYLLS